MRRRSTAFGVTGWLALAVLVLVPLLAVLQYRWLGQLSEGEHERMQRTLSTAAQQFAVEVDGELSKALSALQVDAATLEREAWDVVAQRYDTWAASAITPDIVERVYLAVETPETTSAPGTAPALSLRAWNPGTLAFDAAEWTPDLAPLVPRLQAHVLHAAGRDPSAQGRERLMPPHPLGDERVLVSPVMRVAFPGPGANGRMGAPEMTLLGFTIIALDLDVIRNQVVPAVVRRHLYDADGSTEYRIAVVHRDDEARVIFESEEGAAAAVRTRHDASVDFLTARPTGLMIGRTRGGSPPAPGGPAPRDGALTIATDRVVVNMLEATREGERATTVQTRLFSGRDGYWRLLVAHESGSLDAAVANVRLRNLFLSSGILLLLTVAIALIVGSARRAQDLARQQMEFVAAVSHELRTPVAVINSAAGNLADGVVGDPARVKTYGATIQTEARRLGETVERVLQLAGLEAGQGAANGVVPAEALVHEAVEACQSEIARYGATVECDIAPGLPAIAGDGPALRSAVQNLVGNAVKYGGAEPWVRVSVRRGDGAPRRGAGTVLITVEDRGLGIAAEDRAHVFEPFYRGREAVSRQIQGSGLGLSLVARIAKAHGGRVSLDSDPGRGSRFTLHLPAAPPAPQTAEAVLPESHAVTQGS
ncbi:MAG: HAMP domain-containing sensor histidine kinase [Vicinamibacterales bacterium]|nr:HAMP domain-containing sensor histidine kinase [Vicinamibacterales bacterium]